MYYDTKSVSFIMPDKIVYIFKEHGPWACPLDDFRNMVKNNSFFFIIKTFFQSCTTECLARESGKQNIIM